MTNRNISVDTGTIASSSDEIKFLVEDIRAYINNASSVISKIEAESWKGEGSQAYINNFNDFKNNQLEKSANAFLALANALKMNASQISDTQQNIRMKISSLSGIATSASGALAKNFVNSDRLISEAFTDPNTTFNKREDGTYAIVRDGTVIGYTTEEYLEPADEKIDQNSSDMTPHEQMHQQYGTGPNQASNATAGNSSSGMTPHEQMHQQYGTGPNQTSNVTTGSSYGNSDNSQSNLYNRSNYPNGVTPEQAGWFDAMIDIANKK